MSPDNAGENRKRKRLQFLTKSAATRLSCQSLRISQTRQSNPAPCQVLRVTMRRSDVQAVPKRLHAEAPGKRTKRPTPFPLSGPGALPDAEETLTSNDTAGER